MSLKNFMIESANILFDDSKNDLRALTEDSETSNFISFEFYLVCSI